MKIIIILILSTLFIFSCSRNTINSPFEAMRMIDEGNIKLVDDLDIKTFISGIKNSIEYLKKNPSRKLTFGGHTVLAKEYVEKLSTLLNIKDKNELKETIEEHFNIYEVYGKDQYGEILLTSYYEPIIKGSFVETKKYSQPIYQLPKDLVEVSLTEFSKTKRLGLRNRKGKITGRIESREGYPNRVIPYYTRIEIDNEKKLAGKKLELFWLDPIEAFFLQVQGSGTIKVGKKKYIVGYAGQNGRRYVSIGKYLTHIIPREKMSLQKIEAYLREISRKKMYDIFALNPSYVFFKKLDHRPLTTSGVEVMDGRTIAVDDSLFPLGAMALLKFKRPIINGNQVEMSEDDEISRLVFAHDTGGAINGPGRADLFWGSGKKAKKFAGHMRHPANLYFLGPKKN